MKRMNLHDKNGTHYWHDAETDEQLNQWAQQLIGLPNFLPERQVPTYDENGQPVQDENGDPVMETLPAEFTSEIIDITAQVEAENAKQSRLSAGKQAREACQATLDLIAGYNLERNLTAEQITSMQTTFGTIHQLLMASRPSSAKALIAAIEPDGVIVTQAMIDDCLSLLANY